MPTGSGDSEEGTVGAKRRGLVGKVEDVKKRRSVHSHLGRSLSVDISPQDLLRRLEGTNEPASATSASQKSQKACTFIPIPTLHTN